MDGKYIGFSNRVPLSRNRAPGLTSLAEPVAEYWLQDGQTPDDLDAEAREYYNAYTNETLVDPYRTGVFEIYRAHTEQIPFPQLPVPPQAAEASAMPEEKTNPHATTSVPQFDDMADLDEANES